MIQDDLEDPRLLVRTTINREQRQVGVKPKGLQGIRWCRVLLCVGWLGGVVLGPCFYFCLWKCGSEKVMIAGPQNPQGFCLLFFLEEMSLHPPGRKGWQKDLSTSSSALSPSHQAPRTYD